MQLFRVAGAGVLASLLAAPASADVQFSIAGGRVTLVATDATVRQILDEWARVGGTAFVNAERIAGGPVTLELHDVPERDALEVVLRSVSGYVVAPRATVDPARSRFERVLVLSTSTPVRSVSSPGMPTPSVAPPVAFNAIDDNAAVAPDDSADDPGSINEPPQGRRVPTRGPAAPRFPSGFQPPVPVPGIGAIATPPSSPGMPSNPAGAVGGQAGTITPSTEPIIFRSPSADLDANGNPVPVTGPVPGSVPGMPPSRPPSFPAPPTTSPR